MPLRPALVPAPVCAVLLCWIGGFCSSYNEKRSRRFDGSEIEVLKFHDG